MSHEDAPMVSVWMITYNHQQYLAQAIESVLNQKADFSFELIIGEDCSTDRTREICLEYKKRYPGIIKLLLHDKNVGIHQNVIQTLKACTGKYVALLEGDDYWTDPLKLQNQVNFLSTNSDFAMCYQKTLEIDELSGARKITNEGDNAVTGLSEILERGWFMRTGSLMFRNGLIKQFPPWYFQFSSTDYMLHILIAEHGKIGFLNEITSVYRRHEGGITQAFGRNIVAFNEKKIRLLDIVDEYLNFRFSSEIRKQKRELRTVMVVNGLRYARTAREIIYLLKLIPFINHGRFVKRGLGYLLRKKL